MEIRAVDKNISYTGYIDKSVVKFINNATIEHKKHAVRYHTRFHEKMPSLQKIEAIEHTGYTLLDRLSKIMESTHKNSVLKLKQTSSKGKKYTNLIITNPVTDRVFVVASNNKQEKTDIFLRADILQNWDKEIVPKLEKIGSKGIDGVFLEFLKSDFVNLFNREHVLFKIKMKKLDRLIERTRTYLKDIGFDVPNRAEVENDIDVSLIVDRDLYFANKSNNI